MGGGGGALPVASIRVLNGAMARNRVGFDLLGQIGRRFGGGPLIRVADFGDEGKSGFPIWPPSQIGIPICPHPKIGNPIPGIGKSRLGRAADRPAHLEPCYLLSCSAHTASIGFH